MFTAFVAAQSKMYGRPLLTQISYLNALSVPLATRNGLEGILQHSLQPAFDDKVCFIATVRLAKPQFIKVS